MKRTRVDRPQVRSGVKKVTAADRAELTAVSFRDARVADSLPELQAGMKTGDAAATRRCSAAPVAAGSPEPGDAALSTPWMSADTEDLDEGPTTAPAHATSSAPTSSAATTVTRIRALRNIPPTLAPGLPRASPATAPRDRGRARTTAHLGAGHRPVGLARAGRPEQRICCSGLLVRI